MVNLQHKKHETERDGIIRISYPLPPQNFQEYTNQMAIGTSTHDKLQKPLPCIWQILFFSAGLRKCFLRLNLVCCYKVIIYWTAAQQASTTDDDDK